MDCNVTFHIKHMFMASHLQVRYILKVVRSPGCLNDCPHVTQVHGLTFVCFISWTESSLGRPNDSRQVTRVYGPEFV